MSQAKTMDIKDADRPLVGEKGIEVIRECDWRERPRTLEARAIGVAAAKCVGTYEGDNLLVIEAKVCQLCRMRLAADIAPHAVEDLRNVSQSHNLYKIKCALTFRMWSEP